MKSSLFRNIGIIAHIDAGKTTFTERALFYSKVIQRMGEVHEGSATTDFLPEEQERGITIASACVTCPWNEYLINIVDTPGHVDFTLEVERNLRVLDAAVGIFCGVSGVQPQSEYVWRQAERFGVPKLAVINKMDREGSDYLAVCDALQERFGIRLAPVTIPFGQGESFRGVLDLVREEMVFFDAETQGSIVQRLAFTPDAAALAAPWRERLLDVLTEEDDTLLEICLRGEHPAPAHIDAVLRKGTIHHRFVPVLAMAARRNTGVQPVLDAICAYLPGPDDAPPAQAVGCGESDEAGTAVCVFTDPGVPFTGFVFKVNVTKGQKILFVRVYSGTVRQGDHIVNARTSEQGMVTGLYRIYASSWIPLDTGIAGDIIALEGLDATTGDSLGLLGHTVCFDPVRDLQPVISMAFEPRTEEEGVTLDAGLAFFMADDHSLRLTFQNGQRIVSGMGELHLEIVKERIEREFGIIPRVGNPQVMYFEVPASSVEATGTYDREQGGVPHFGSVTLLVEPAEQGAGLHVRVADSFGMPRDFSQAIEEGIHTACSVGAQGFPLTDALVTIIGTEERQGDTVSSDMNVAAQFACALALEKGNTKIEEPIMRVVIITPDAQLGNVMTLLGMCAARVESLIDKSGQKEVIAFAPMRELFGFSTRLRSASQGRAGVTMHFDHYAPAETGR